jgi:DNA-binding transcriptional LysR family regulator
VDTELFSRFVAAIECGSLNKAAQALNVSQPAISKSIQQLEVTFGVPLLHRGVRGVHPTEFGRVVFDRAKLLQVELATMRSEIEALRTLTRGKVAIGVPPGLSRVGRLMVEATSNVLRNRIRLSLDMVIGTRSQLMPALRTGTLDLVIGLGPASPGDGLTYEPLFVDEDVIAVHSKHPLAARDTVRVMDLFRYGWIVAVESARLAEELTCAGANEGVVFDHSIIHSNSSLYIRQALAGSDFVGIMDRDGIELEMHPGEFRQLTLVDAGRLNSQRRELGLYHRGELGLSTAGRGLLREIRRAGSLARPSARTPGATADAV